MFEKSAVNKVWGHMLNNKEKIGIYFSIGSLLYSVHRLHIVHVNK